MNNKQKSNNKTEEQNNLRDRLEQPSLFYVKLIIRKSSINIVWHENERKHEHKQSSQNEWKFFFLFSWKC